VEVFPFWYNKPFVFGSIQVSLRLAGMHHRSYLAEESSTKSTLMSWFERLDPLVTARSCVRSFTCGAAAKAQDVSMSPYFIARVARFLRVQFNYGNETNIFA
jgi:hypothetical protein